MLGLAIMGLVISGAIVMFVAQSRSPQAAAPTPDTRPATAPPTRPPDVPEPDAAEAIAITKPAASAPEDATPDHVAATDSRASRGTRPKDATRGTPRGPTGPVSTKQEAEQVLRPELLTCMKEHGVHYLITRLGNKRRSGTVLPLGLTGTSIVDYKPTPGFASTPLGRCVARAASAVRAPAYGGNYIYFGLRQDSVPDPLADAAARLDTTGAEAALSALDDEARDCVTRSPNGSRPGESVRIMVYFQGATGQVSRVEPYYVDVKSPYGRCLSSVYRKATVDRFREIDHKVLHVVQP